MTEIYLLATLFLWGILMIAKPDILWGIEHSGEMNQDRPSEKYLRRRRGIGIGCLVFAAVFLTVIILEKFVA